MATQTEPNKRVNYFNNQKVNVEDLQQQQLFDTQRSKDLAAAATLDGISAVSGLLIEVDTIMAEPVEFPVVANSGTPTLGSRNFQRLPGAVGEDIEARLYQVFQAKADNIQRADLKIQYNQVTGDSNVIVEVRELLNGSNPLSGLSDNSLFTVAFSASDLASVSEDGRLVINMSEANNNTGITVTEDLYYAIVLRYTRGLSSQDTLDIFHSNDQTQDLDSDLSAYFLVNGQFQQGLFDEESTFRQFALYHKVITDAVKVGPGVAFFRGKRIIIEDAEQFRFLSLRDRTPVSDTNEAVNYVVVEFEEEFTDEIEEERTRNLVATRAVSTSAVSVLTQAEWDLEVAKDEEEQTKLLLGTVTDRNIVRLNHVETFTIGTTNLAYHNWLNPSFSVPSSEAVVLRQSRPNDFIFFLDSIPTEVPLVDAAGIQQVDDSGNPVSDAIISVFVIIQPTTDNVRRFEMGSVSSSGTYRNYAAILSADVVAVSDTYTFNLNQDEITPNTFYNFVAITENGRSIFIQDYDRQIIGEDPVTQESVLVRTEVFPSHLREGDYTIVIDRDLQLATSTLNNELGNEPAVNAEAVQITDELLGKVLAIPGSSTLEDIADTLLDAGVVGESFFLSPLPLSDSSKVLVTDDDASVQAAYAAGDIVLLYRNPDQTTPINIELSGSLTTDKGGLGASQTISGTINLPVGGNTGKVVKIRNIDGQDVTDQATVSTTFDDGGILSYTVTARGRGVGLDSGLFAGETAFLWIDDLDALDGGGFQIGFEFDPNTPIVLDVDSLGATKRFFGERVVVSAGDHPVLNADEVSVDPVTGEVKFAVGFGMPTGVEFTTEFKRLQVVDEEINYFQLAFPPMGFSTAIAIENTDSSVATAYSLGDFAISVELDPTGSPGVFTDITDPGYPGGPKTIVAGKATDAINAGEVSVNPETGLVRFHKTEFPASDERTIISYYFLRLTYASQGSQSGAVYDLVYDLNSDGRIDDSDLALFLQAFPSEVGDPNYVAEYDFVNPAEGKIDYDDLDALMQRFGTVSSGTRDFADATTARLAAILTYKQDDAAIKLQTVSAQSSAPTVENPNGKTVLFLSKDTPVPLTGDYVVQFGFSALLVIGPTSITVQTGTQLPSNLNLQAIHFGKIDDSTVTRQITNNVVTADEVSGSVVYNNQFEFQPPLSESGDYQLVTEWEPDNIAIVTGSKLVKVLEYDVRHRRLFGPFGMMYGSDDFKQDGTSISIVFQADEASYDDGTPDATGRHIQGVPIQDMSFTVILEVPTTTTNERNVWIWNHLRVATGATALELSFNDALSLQSRYQGRDKTPVLQPFGVADTQIALKPKFAGGDLENNLSNITVFRDDIVPTGIPEHRHTATEGGVLLSDLLQVADPSLRFAPESSVTDALYQILDRLEVLGG